MSHSPHSEDGSKDAYLLGWRALSRHLRRGLSWSGHERDTAFAGLGDASFVDVSSISGLDLGDDGRSAVTLDLDLDGDLDVLRTGRGTPRLRCLLNQSEPHGGFIGIRLVGRGAMGDGIGARVELTAKDGAMSSWVRRAGSGFLAQEGPWTLSATPAGQVVVAKVLWPDGESQLFADLLPGRRYVLRQTSGKAQRFVPPGLSPLLDGEHSKETSKPTVSGRLVASAPLPIPKLLIHDQDGAQRRILGALSNPADRGGAPTLLHVFSVDCAPCVAGLPALAKSATRWVAGGVKVMALSLDPSSEQLRVEGLLQKTGWPGLRGRIPEQSLRILNALDGYLSDSDRPMVSPTTYMFDGRGRLVALYRGPLDEAQVEADFGLATALDPVLRRGFAGLRPGRWVQAPVKEEGAGFVSVLKLRGLGDAAKELEALAFEVQDLDSPGALVEMARARWLQGQREAARQLMVDALSLDEQSGGRSGLRITWLRSLASMETILEHDQRALKLWDQLLEATPEDYGVWVGRGVVLHRMGKVVDYNQLLGELTEKAPEFAAQLVDLVDKGDR